MPQLNWKGSLKRWAKAWAPEGSRRRAFIKGTRHALRTWLPSADRSVAPKAQICSLDVTDSAALRTFLNGCGYTLPPCSPADVEGSPLGAARFILALLANRPDLRIAYPRALSEGVAGRFCGWICAEGVAEYGLSTGAAENFRAAFQSHPGVRVLQLYQFRSDLRQAFPLALTPVGCAGFMKWLLTAGRNEASLSIEQVLWFAFECAEDPADALAATYLMNPDWQERFPLGLTRFGRRAFLAWVSENYGIGLDWLRGAELPAVLAPPDELRLLYLSRPDLQAWLPRAFSDPRATWRLLGWLAAGGRSPAALDDAWWRQVQDASSAGLLEQPGVNVLGHFCYPSGLQEATRSAVRAFERAGVRVLSRDVPANLQSDSPEHADHLGLELFDTTLLTVAPEPLFEIAYPLAGLAWRPGVRRIAVWYWELEAVPPEWARHAREVEEIWAPTRFIADAMSRAMPVPVVHMLPGVELKPFDRLPRAHFGLPEDRSLFLFLFDMNSIMERKNPLGLLEAYRRAFGGDDRTTLVIKVTRGDAEPGNLRRLQQAADAAGAIVINRVMTREESYALIDACDCYVSLHRSEGFGLTLAEAMLMGKPAIGTAYSGNLDFMTPQNSLLVGYERVPITRDLTFYRKGCVWAEPDVAEAARHMRWVYEHPQEARALGTRARVEVGALLSLEAAGKRMANRLHELREHRAGRPERDAA